MKILICLIRESGGVGNANKEIANELRKRGHEVDLIFREDDLGIYSFRKSIQEIRKFVKSRIVTENYDIIYTQDYSMAFPLLFPTRIFRNRHFNCLIGKKRNIKGQRIHKFLQDYVGNKMKDKLIVINDFNHERFPKSHLVYRGVNLKRFKPLKKKRDCFGFIDKFSEQLDKEKYIKIANELNLKPIWAGKSGETKSVDKAYGKIIVHSFDKIPDKKMNEFYNRCKVFVNLATPDAGFNLSWLESMASGVPIVIGNFCGAGKILPTDKVYHILSSEPIETQIKDTVKNSNLLIKHKLRTDYRKWIQKNKFTWKNCVDKLLTIWENDKRNL